MDGRSFSSYLPRSLVGMTPLQRKIARARLLRRQGKTYAEIRAAVGPVSDDRLQTWLVGIPRPPQTRLSHPLPELRRECRRLRLEGLSYSEIAAKTGASAGSLSLWLRDLRNVPSVRDAARRRAKRGPNVSGAARKAKAIAARQARIEAAAAELGPISNRDLLVAGFVLYWAEGSKAKPWRPNDRQMQFTNSDADVIRVYLAWLDLVGVPREARSFRLSIHEHADVDRQQLWWARELGVPLEQFLSPTLKRHKPTTVRHNTGDSYHGCLVVRALRSVSLYDRVEGMWRGMAEGARAYSLFEPSRVVQRQDPRFWSERSRFESSPGSDRPSAAF